MKLIEKYGANVDAGWDCLAGYQKGDTVSWAELERAIGMHRDERGGWQIIRRLRRRLLRDRQITAFPDPTIGLRLLTDMQAATEVPELRQKRARRQIQRGLKETEAVDLSRVSNHAATSLALARKHMKAQRLAITRGRREAETLLKPTGRR
jgi:hypothetical protein